MRVMVVNDETVGVTHRPVTMRMPMRFVSGRGFVVVVVVGPVSVNVFVDQFGVAVGQDLRVVLRP